MSEKVVMLFRTRDSYVCVFPEPSASTLEDLQCHFLTTPQIASAKEQW